MKRILVTGDRNWSSVDAVRTILSKEPLPCELIHGAARGLDSIAALVAAKLGWAVVAYPAEWEKYGRAAGPIRNRKMLAAQPDFVYAFHNDIGNSRGTRDCIKAAKKLGIPGRLFNESGLVVEEW